MADLKQTRIVTVDNLAGLHVRAAYRIAKLALEHQDADLALVKDAQPAQASSVWEVLALGAKPGDKLVLEASGPRAQEALDALERLFARKFDEADEDTRAQG
jgi:phosphotransferase system HPr (HPr) family protein